MVLFLLLVAPALAPAAASEVWRFGIVPQQPATKLVRLWTPLLEAVAERAGVELDFATAPDIPTFEARLAAGEYDFAYMNPYHYVVYHREPGYEAFARERGKRLQGLMVTPATGPIQDLSDLAGRRIAFPAPGAFAASIVTRAELRRRGIPVEPVYVDSHDSVYRAVGAGLYPAGGGVIRTYFIMPPHFQARLRVLWLSPGFSPHAFAAHPRVPAAVVEDVARTMVTLGDRMAGRELLGAVNLKVLERARDSDWDDIRSLDLELPALPGMD